MRVKIVGHTEGIPVGYIEEDTDTSFDGCIVSEIDGAFDGCKFGVTDGILWQYYWDWMLDQVYIDTLLDVRYDKLMINL